MSGQASGIADNIRSVRAHIPAGVTLVCVSKFHPVEAIQEAYETGERHFGESRVQELQQKVPQLPADIHWHFIGHLQTNKVRDLLKLRPYLIQSVDSERLLRTINDEAAKMGFVQDVLLEVHVAKEETKTGMSPSEYEEILDFTRHNLLNVRICGVMVMATNTDDEQEIRRCFELAKSLYDRINRPIVNGPIVHLSMGMSDDYRIAIECGSTMVRIGSTIFGERAYPTSSQPGSSLPKAVFFDQDGVLFNSMPYHARSWEKAMNENGLPFTADQTYRNEGRTGASVIREAYLSVNKGSEPVDEAFMTELCERVYSAKSKYFNQFTGGQLPELIPGIMEVMTFLHEHGVECWVVTGSGQHSLIDNLHKTFPNMLSGIISAFDVKHGKPDPEPYLKAWERSGFKKEECFVVENAPLGVRAGKAAGLFVIAVNTGPLPDSALAAEAADLVLPDMSALLRFLKSLKNNS